MKLETLQTGLETLDKFKQDQSLANPKQEQIDNYVIGLQDNWAIDGATIGAELVEKAVDDSSELIFQSTPSSSLDSAQFRLENDGLQDRPGLDNVAFFNAPGDKWSQPGGKGNPVTITYSYTNLLDGSIKGLSKGTVKAAMEEAFKTWANVAPLNFTEVKDSRRDSQIRIGQEYIDGNGGTLAYAYFPSDGDIKFDRGDRWDIDIFLETAVHELGHSLR